MSTTSRLAQATVAVSTLAVLLATGLACGSAQRGPMPSPAPSYEGRPLADVARERGVGLGAFPDGFDKGSAAFKDLLAREFTQITIPAYWCVVESTKGVLDFSQPDTLADFARSRGLLLRGHPLTYQVCVPQWLEQATLTRSGMMALLKEHVQTIAARYRGRVRVWDVVNEALTYDGAPNAKSQMLWGTVPIDDNLFTRSIGPDYVEMAFRWAHEADPEARLYYNEYGAEGSTAKADRLFDLVSGLLARGVPIHGVGFQAHTGYTSPPNEGAFATTLQRFADLGLDVQITEADVDINGSVDRRRLPLPAEPELGRRLALQADIYASMMRVCLNQPRCVAFTTWGVTDAYTWLDWFDNPQALKTAPLLFDTSNAPKAAAAAVRTTLSGSARRP